MKKYRKLANKIGLLMMGFLLVFNFWLVPQAANSTQAGPTNLGIVQVAHAEEIKTVKFEDLQKAPAKPGTAKPKAGISTADPSSSANDVAANLLAGLSKIIKLLQVIFWPILLMIGSLMQNDILYGAGMEQRLLEIWANIRNIVNIFMVLILLGIALSNVVGGAMENYHLKVILPKFIIALIAVNFTFIGIKVVLDAVNIVSTAIFALPKSVEDSLRNQTITDPDKIGMFTRADIKAMCSSIYGADAGSAEYRENIRISETAGGVGSSICVQVESDGLNKSFLSPKAATFFTTLNSNNAALVMAITFQKANLLDKVYGNATKLNIDTITINVLFSIVLYVIFGTAFVALFVTLLVRLVVLWIMIAISPLMVLPFVLPEKLKSMLGEGDLVNKFVKNAIVPIPIALVMSVGYVMLQGLEHVNLVGGGNKINLKTPTVSLNLLTSGLSTLQQLLVALGAAAFIWVGVFAAMKDTYSHGITDAIKGGVGTAGKELSKFALGSIPLFPIKNKSGKTEMASAGAVGQAVHQLRMLPQQKFNEDSQRLFSEIYPHGSEFGQKISTAHDFGDAKKIAKDTPASLAGQLSYQDGWAKFFETTNGKLLHGNFPTWFAGTALANKPPQEVIAGLKGGISKEDMLIWQGRAGITMSNKEVAAQGPLNSEDAGKEASRKHLISEANSGKAKDSEKIKGLDQKIEAGKTAAPGSEAAKAGDAAKTELDKLVEAAEAAEKKAAAGPSISAEVGDALAKGDDKAKFAALDKALTARFEKVKGNPADEAQLFVDAGFYISPQAKQALLDAAPNKGKDSMVSRIKVVEPTPAPATPAAAAPKAAAQGHGAAAPTPAKAPPPATGKGATVESPSKDG